MKLLIENWRNYLNEARTLSDYDVGGSLRVYHYARSEKDSLVLDPEYFLKNRSSHSRKDYAASSLPRVFFYTNLDHAEDIVKSGRTLYTAFLESGRIYDLASDEQNLRQKARPYPTVPTVDFDKLLRGIESGDLTDGESYDGVFYRSGDMDVLVYFKSIKVEKFNSESVQSED